MSHDKIGLFVSVLELIFDLACRIQGCFVFSKWIWAMGKDAMPYFNIWILPTLLFTGVRVKRVSPYYQGTLLHFEQKDIYINIFHFVH